MLKIEKRDLKTFSNTLQNGLTVAFKATGKVTVFYIAVEIIGAIIPPFQFLVSKKIIDAVVTSLSLPITQALNNTLPFLILALLLSGIQNLFTRISFGLDLRIWDEMAKYGHTSVMKQSLKLDLSYFESSKYYDQFERATQHIDSCLPRIFFSSVSIVTAGVAFLGAALLLFSFHPSLIPVVILISLPSLLWGMGYSLTTFNLASSRIPEGRKAAYLADLSSDKSAVKEIKLFTLGKYFLKRYLKFYERVVKENSEAARKQFSGAFWANCIENIVYYAYLGYVILKVFRGVLTIGDISLFISAFNQASGQLSGTLRHFNTIYDQSLYLNDYLKFMELKPQIVDRAEAKRLSKIESIEFKNVSFRYSENEPFVLKNINFEINPQENIALVGENGAGKTTLVKLLCRFYDVTEGEILINGQNIKTYQQDDLHAQIGAIFQDFNRYELSAKENIGFGQINKMNDLEGIKKAAQKAQAAEFIEKLPKGYENYLGRQFEEGVDLSLGQWQRVALARAFFRNASLLILDEPTASLDAQAEADIFAKFLELTQGKITILISHRFSTVKLANKIIVISKGEIREIDSHSGLMTKNGIYAKLFRLQAQAYEMTGDTLGS